MEQMNPQSNIIQPDAALIAASVEQPDGGFPDSPEGKIGSLQREIETMQERERGLAEKVAFEPNIQAHKDLLQQTKSDIAFAQEKLNSMLKEYGEQGPQQ